MANLVTPADIKGIERPNSFNAYQRAEEEFNMKKQLAAAQAEYYGARATGALSGGNSPAAIQINDEIEKRLAIGDYEGAQRIADAAKIYDKGLMVYGNTSPTATNLNGLNPMLPALVQQESGGNPNAISPKGAAGAFQIMPDTAADPGFGVTPLQGWDGKDPRTATQAEQQRFANDYLNAMQARYGGDQRLAAASYNAGPGAVDQVIRQLPAETRQYVQNVAVSRPGYDTALATRAARKKSAEEQAQYNVKQAEEPKLEFNKKVAEKDAIQVGKNQETLAGLDGMTFSIAQARELLPKAAMTGPVFGRIGAAAEDPDYRNLQGAINSITLQAKDLYNLGSGQGFTDADRTFLQEVIAGKYARAETIGLGLDRMERALANRQAFLNKQTADIVAKYGQAAQPALTTNALPVSPARQLGSRERAESIFNAKKAARSANDAQKQIIRQRLQDAGIDPKEAGL